MPTCLRPTHAVLLLCGFALLASGRTSSNTRVSHTDSVPVLNRVTFDGNVFDETVHAEHWVVLFCVDWYTPCQKLRGSYLDLASEYERKLNANLLLQLSVRFAEVDCAVDKVLCNEQLVQTYPSVVHYSRGKRVGEWESQGGKLDKEEEKMQKFLEGEMNSRTAQARDDLRSGGETGGLWDLPPAQQHPVTTAIRLAPPAAAIVGMVVWIFTAGAEVIRGLRQLYPGSAEQLRRASQSSSGELKKPGQQQRQQQHQAREGLLKRLPESWARERQSIEL